MPSLPGIHFVSDFIFSQEHVLWWWQKSLSSLHRERKQKVTSHYTYRPSPRSSSSSSLAQRGSVGDEFTLPELVFCVFSETGAYRIAFISLPEECPQDIMLFTRSYAETLSQACDHIHTSARADQTKRICNLKIYEDVVTGVEQQDQFTYLLMLRCKRDSLHNRGEGGRTVGGMGKWDILRI